MGNDENRTPAAQPVDVPQALP
ncbi:hypothetical protein Cabther_B0376 [Chloracidobacterium thermophilum B]|uniref:Uncharacterized protein n=1 Tax=Chloracidobacterium thermophilum (strain B) TaxID=981222 RepID=G2LLA3_CHLTF|nr:hypothetical protein Cabther_B0376 [Chloracidobacterium thermophilum B]